ncbi:uncharacterized protein LOC121180808 [Toxotes jaculatrix]|uniref:uncharacterized protein LOC121180808 n=1 Tax=Toxotes jaculatrix TaxID=941984 RepID=UPI001B3B1004|nr:uncharacterized protein LOC121180808 [Toxotes jaculatrix]
MLLAQAGCLFMGFVLHISGVHGRANRMCALKGSSLELPCSAEHLTSSKKWYTLHGKDRGYILSNFSGDGNRVSYNTSEGSNFTLTFNDLRESDENVYCCGPMTEVPGHCWFHRIELQVTDLQVKAIPTTEGQKVTLMCSTSCPLTENPEAYIWYKNGELLYQDWSPWYQELVSSEEDIRYSCAIKGVKNLSAPEMSVDSVTLTCFTVTYANGGMCSYNETSVDEPCSITYPREIYVQRTHIDVEYVRLTCTPGCPLTDSQTAYRWYWNGHLYRYSESQNFTVPFKSSEDSFFCAVKGHEDLRTAEVCSLGHACWNVNYVSRRICALQGSSVNISSENLYPVNLKPFWYKVKNSNKEDAEELSSAGRVKYRDMNGHQILQITNLTRNDSAEYTLRIQTYNNKRKWSIFPGVTLVVSGLKVRMTPSAVVTEGQRVTLTCSTNCPLTGDTTYIWYSNSRPLTLPGNQNKHLVLDPVSWQHAGNYSCAVKNITSPVETLTVQVLGMSIAAINILRLTVAFLIPVPLLVFHVWMRWTRPSW